MSKASRVQESEVFWFSTYRNPPTFHASKDHAVNLLSDEYDESSVSRAVIPVRAERNLDFCKKCSKEYQ